MLLRTSSTTACLRAWALAALLAHVAVVVGLDSPPITTDVGANIKAILFAHTVSGWGYIERILYTPEKPFYLNDGFCMALAIQDMLESEDPDSDMSPSSPRQRSLLSQGLWARIGSSSDPTVMGYRDTLKTMSPQPETRAYDAWRRALLGAQGLFFLRTAAAHHMGRPVDFPLQGSPLGSGISVRRGLIQDLVHILENPSPATYQPHQDLRGGAEGLIRWLEGLVSPLEKAKGMAKGDQVVSYSKLAEFKNVPDHARLLALDFQGFLHGVAQENPRPFELAGPPSRRWRKIWWRANSEQVLFQHEPSPRSTQQGQLRYSLTSPAEPYFEPRYPKLVSLARLVNEYAGSLSAQFIDSKGRIRDALTTPIGDDVPTKAGDDAPEVLWKAL